MEGWGARAHSPGLVVACVRSCMLAVVRGRSSCGRSSLFVCIASSFVCVPSSFVCIPSSFVCPWAFISVSGHASSSMGVRLHSWALVFVCVWPALFVHVRFGIVVHCWEVGGSSWPFVV